MRFNILLGNSRQVILLLVLVILAGTFLRLYKLGCNDLWYDEAVSVLSADRITEIYSSSNEQLPYGNPASEAWQPKSPYYRRSDPQPFFYYLTLRFCMNVLGRGAFSLRLLSAIFGILSILMVYKLGIKLFDKRAAVYAAFLISISPLHIWYGQEARQYSLAALLAVLCAYFLFLALEKRDNRFWAGYIFSAVLLVYTNYIGIFVLICGWALFVVKKYRFSIKRWLFANVIITLLFLPWLNIFWQHFIFITDNFWLSRPSLFSIMITLKNFGIGYSNFRYFFIPSVILFPGLALLGLSQLDRNVKVFLAAFLCLPVIVIFIVSQFIPIYLDRQLILFSPFYYLAIGKGISAVKPARTRVLIICLVLVLIIPSLYNYFSGYMPVEPCIYHQGAYVKKPFRPAVNYIEDNWKEGDTLIYSHVSVKPSFIYYQKYGNLKQNDREIHDHKRIWLVSSSWPRDGCLSRKVLLLRERLNRLYKKTDSAEFDGIFIELYE